MRKSRMRLRFFMGVLGAFVLLAGCREEGHAQQQEDSVEKAEATEVSLKQRCKELSAQSEYDYEMLSGTAIVVEKSFSPIDCLTEDCFLDLSAHFFAFIEAKNGERFRVVTPTETFRTLHPKPLYMEKGKSYAFCARRTIDVRGNPGHNDPKYAIDNLDTIQLLQEQE